MIIQIETRDDNTVAVTSEEPLGISDALMMVRLAEYELIGLHLNGVAASEAEADADAFTVEDEDATEL